LRDCWKPITLRHPPWRIRVTHLGVILGSALQEYWCQALRGSAAQEYVFCDGIPHSPPDLPGQVRAPARKENPVILSEILTWSF